MIPVKQKTTVWTATEQLCEPETVVRVLGTDTLIISNICGFKKNGKGYLSLLDVNGDLIEARWVDALNAPAGLAIRDGTLFAVDVDTVHSIDIETGTITHSYVTEPATRALNDIAIAPDGRIFVSDSASARVLVLSNGKFTAFPDDEAEFPTANGLHIQNNTLFIGGAELWAIDLSDLSIKTINYDRLNDIDGIESDGDGGLIVSIVGGDVWHIPASGGAEIWTTTDLSSTNHAHLPDLGIVIMPTGYDNTLIAFETGEITARD